MSIQVLTRLNHLSITISYNAVLKLAQEIGKLNEVPIKQWILANQSFKFVGDNVDVSMGVRDLRSDHVKHLRHMYSILAVKSRVSPPQHAACTLQRPLQLVNTDCFLPNERDISSIRLNLACIVSRILCTYIKGLQKFRKLVPQHILHRNSVAMSKKSEVTVLDVLYKNEASHKDMLDIMKHQQSYLGANYKGTVPSGGDLLTCERQRCAQQHVMDSDTREERLEFLEPVIEDWHTLMCLFQVSSN